MDYLLFERSEPAEGVVSFEASVSVPIARWPRVEGEVAAVLAWWAAQRCPGPGPLDEGHDWDLDCSGSVEWSAPAEVRVDLAASALRFVPAENRLERRTLHLTVTTNDALAQSFVDAGFAGDE